MNADAAPFVIVVSGPSGVGKSAVCDLLVARDAALAHSISTTTREPRGDEVPGQDYHFSAESDFRQGIEAGDFLEWAEVHNHLYGTLRLNIERHLESGRCPVLNIDVQGGRTIKEALPQALLVFLMPPDVETLEARLRGRGTDSEERLQVRLTNAAVEMTQSAFYDHVVVNDDLDRAVREVESIIAQGAPNPLGP